jgi:hypothetical protein
MTIGPAHTVSACDAAVPTGTYARSMRDSRSTLHSLVLLSALLLLLVASVAGPVAANSPSGLPPTISMDPTSAGPGSVVEVTGIDFPSQQLIEIQLDTAAGRSDLAVLITTDDGYFRKFVELPADVSAGWWELRVTALNGVSASHAFDAASADTVDVTGASEAASAAGLSVRRGNTGSDIMVMLVLAVLLAAVGGGAAYAWREVRGEHMQPGMGAGTDPIWSVAGSDDPGPELIGSNQPDLGALHGES